MLSIIISSYQPEFYNELEKNIAETCGIQYEIIKIDNPNLMGICEAYNKGAAKAQYDYLLFLHEDVIFHTKNWGEKLIKHLELTNTGIIGIAGSNYVPVSPSSWHVADNNCNFSNYIQNNKEKSNARIVITLEKTVPAFAIDGVFLAVTKTVYHEFLFDENIKGFHGYDLDFTLRVATKYENFIIHDILLEHFSEGNPDENWLKANIYIRKKLGAGFNHPKNTETEVKMFLGFLYTYFGFFKVNFKNLIFSLQFFPLRHITLKGFFVILKKYYAYIRHSKELNLNKHE